MEKIVKNGNKIAYIVSSGNYHRKVYMTATCNSTRSIQTTAPQYTGRYYFHGTVDISGTFYSTSTYSQHLETFNDVRVLQSSPIYPFMTEQHGTSWSNEDLLPSGGYDIQASASTYIAQQTTTQQTYTTVTNQLYVLKSYSESKASYSISAFKTYSVTKSLPATVYVIDTAIRVFTYSTKSTPGSGYSSSRSGLATEINTFRNTATLTYSIEELHSWQQIGPYSHSSTSWSTGYTTYSHSTVSIPQSVAHTSLATSSALTNWKNIRYVNAPITPDISSSESATFTSSSNNRTYYTTDNYKSTFDADFYGSAYPDVAAAYSSKTSAYSSHWTAHGYSENRIANSEGFFVLSTSFGGFATTTSGFPKRMAIRYNSDLPVSYYSTITSKTQLRRTTGMTNNNLSTITTVWSASESIVSQYTDSITSTIDILSRTY